MGFLVSNKAVAAFFENKPPWMGIKVDLHIISIPPEPLLPRQDLPHF